VFQVYTRGNASTVSNLAYTSGPLGMHTDLNSMERCPDVQILHTIKQTTDCGGANQLADGLAVAQLLRDEQPEIFKLLCTHKFEYIDHAVDHENFCMASRRTVIQLNEDGTIGDVHFHQHSRTWFNDAPVEQVPALYAALKMWNDYCYQPRNLLNIKLKAGEAIMFANNRVLHARSAFTLRTSDDERQLEGCYYSWDTVKSRLRFLKHQYHIINHSTFG